MSAVVDLREARVGRQVPADLTAEEALLGAMLLSNEAIVVGLDRLTADALHKTAHQHIFHAIARVHRRGDPVDPVTVADELRRMKLLDAVGGFPTLAKLHASTAATSNAKRYARIIADHHLLRRMIATAGAISELGYDVPEDVGEAIGKAEALMRSLEDLQRKELPDGYSSLDAFLRRSEETEEESFPWLVGGIIKRGWRIVVIGPGGIGKSMLLQQIAVSAAGGMHPFNGSYLEKPLSTLIVDAENPEERLDSGIRPLRDAALEAAVYEEENCHLWRCPAGIDLTRHRYQSELEAVVRDCNPDLVVMGPAYKLAPMRRGDSNEVVATLMEYLDQLRTDYQFALMIETHPPKSDGGAMSAFGSGQWGWWPDMAVTLEPTEIDSMPLDGPRCFEIGRAREDRLENEWPKVVRHRWADARRAEKDGPWPWVVVESEDPNAF